MTDSADRDQLSLAIDAAVRTHRRKWVAVTVASCVLAALFLLSAAYEYHEQRQQQLADSMLVHDMRAADDVAGLAVIAVQLNSDASLPQGPVQRTRDGRTTAWAKLLKHDIQCSDGARPVYAGDILNMHVLCGSIDFDSKSGNITIRDSRTGMIRYPQ